jgi:uncharacterized protein with GYD domain
MLSDLTLTSSGFPVEYGRAEGCIVTLATREPRTDRWRVGGSIGLLDSSVTAEGRRDRGMELGGSAMARFIVLFDWTDQGVRTAQDSPRRVAEARAALHPMGVTIEAIYWTLGSHDLVGILTAPDPETLAAALLKVAGAGNVRTTTLRAFDETEFAAVLGKMG